MKNDKVSGSRFAFGNVLRKIFLPNGFRDSFTSWLIILFIFSIPVAFLTGVIGIQLLLFAFPVYYLLIHFDPNIRSGVSKVIDMKFGVDSSIKKNHATLRNTKEAKQEKSYCAECGAGFSFFGITKTYEGRTVCSNCYNKLIGKYRKKETKCTCNQCGKVWHYLAEDEALEANKQQQNTSKACMQSTACCGSPMGCVGAVMPYQEVKDLSKCPQCGSRDIKRKVIEYEPSAD